MTLECINPADLPAPPAHYPGHGGATVVARGDAFMVDDWLELPPI